MDEIDVDVFDAVPVCAVATKVSSALMSSALTDAPSASRHFARTHEEQPAHRAVRPSKG